MKLFGPRNTILALPTETSTPFLTAAILIPSSRTDISTPPLAVF